MLHNYFIYLFIFRRAGLKQSVMLGVVGAVERIKVHGRVFVKSVLVVTPVMHVAWIWSAGVRQRWRGLTALG